MSRWHSAIAVGLLAITAASPSAWALVDTTVTAKGDCNIAAGRDAKNNTINCYGISQKALDRLNELLDKKDLELDEKTREADNWLRQYLFVEKQLSELDDGSDLARKADAALNDGELEVAGRLLDQLIARREAPLAKSYASRAGVFALNYEYNNALEYYKKALSLLPDDIELLNSAGQIALEIGSYDQAEMWIKHAVDLQNEAINNLNVEQILSSLNNLAIAYLNIGQYTDAKKLFEKAISLDEQNYGPEHVDLMIYLNNITRACIANKQYDEALLYLNRAINIGSKASNSPYEYRLALSASSGELLLAMGDEAEAEKIFEEIVADAEQNLNSKNSSLNGILKRITGLYLKNHRYKETIPYLEKIVAVDEATGHRDLGNDLNNLGMAYWKSGRFDEAVPVFDKAIKIGEKTPDHPSSELAIWLSNLAGVYWEAGRYVEALPFQERALRIVDASTPPDPGMQALFRERYAGLLEQLGRGTEASEFRVQAEAIRRGGSRRHRRSVELRPRRTACPFMPGRLTSGMHAMMKAATWIGKPRPSIAKATRRATTPPSTRRLPSIATCSR